VSDLSLANRYKMGRAKHLREMAGRL